uniref:Uncharacterized protein n=1 Tax=Haptolina ericina TaxID=156174 RepID=A0A7S3BTU9_9EUKA
MRRDSRSTLHQSPTSQRAKSAGGDRDPTRDRMDIACVRRHAWTRDSHAMLSADLTILAVSSLWSLTHAAQHNHASSPRASTPPTTFCVARLGPIQRCTRPCFSAQHSK